MLQNRIRDARSGNSEAGFTLVELLIVIVVLGILASIVVFGVGTFRADAKASACAADKKTVSVAADAWIAKNGSAPTLDELTGANYLKTAPANLATPVVISATGDVTSGCVA